MDEPIKQFADTLYQHSRHRSAEVLRKERVKAARETAARRGTSNLPLSGSEIQIFANLFLQHVNRCMKARLSSYRGAFKEAKRHPDEGQFTEIWKAVQDAQTLEIQNAARALHDFLKPRGFEADFTQDLTTSSAHEHDSLLGEWKVWRDRVRLIKTAESGAKANHKKDSNYGLSILWIVGSVVIPVGWGELAPTLNLSGTVHVWVGLVLWLIPYLLAVRILRGYLRQRGWGRHLTTLATLLALGVFTYPAWNLVQFVTQPTYIYLAPSVGLMECQKRAFILKKSGSQPLSDVDIGVRDNKSGTTYSQHFPKIDQSQVASPLYMWLQPSSPWDEDYSFKVSAREMNSSERLILRDVHHRVQFAMEITLDTEQKPVESCRDELLPTSYTVASGTHRTCSALTELQSNVLENLEWYSLQNPDGNLTIRKLRALPSPSELDEQSDERHITDYQKQIIRPVIKKYANSRVAIFYAGGSKARAYAREFEYLFRSEGWGAGAPKIVPVGDERIIDVQLSTGGELGKQDFQTIRAAEIVNAFKQAGIKQRTHYVVDPHVAKDVAVLWVGPKSPKDVSPDQCLPAELEPRLGEHHTCEMIAQTQGCPLVPE